MGFIKAFTGSLSGTFADQWKDFYKPMDGVSATAGLFRAVPQGTNNGRGENTKGSNNIISNGSKIVVPEGTALITMQDGGITGIITDAGGYIYNSTDPNSQSIFVGDGIISSTIKSSWEKFKFGGQPGAEQLAFYVNLKIISDIRFGTPAPIKWNDSYFESKVGAVARGTYSLKISDPILFIKNFVPVQYLQSNSEPFDFNDVDNKAGDQLLQEFVNTLSAGITMLSRDAKANGVDTYDYISENRIKFGQAMSTEVENNYHWQTERGLEIENVTLTLEYDEATEELLKEFQQDDKEIRKAKRMLNEVEARRGEIYSQNMSGMMAAATGQAMQSAASNENGAMMGFMGMNMAQQNGANMFGAFNNYQQPQQQMQQQPQQSTQQDQPVQPTQDSTTKLLEMKKLLDAGAITQEEYDRVKAQVLGL